MRNLDTEAGGDSGGSHCSTFLVRGPDGEEFEFIPRYGYQRNDIDYLAQAVAKDDYEQCGPDLCDTSMWPREYEILWEGAWRKVSVSMEYDPVFSSNRIAHGRRP
jgi:hypothetical protein